MKKPSFSVRIVLAFALLFFLAPICAQALTEKVNVNTATIKELQKLPFIGKERAKAIVHYRKKHGPFVFLSDLKNIPAIGLGTYDAIRPHLKLTSRHSVAADPHGSIASLTVSPRLRTSPGEIIMLPNSDYFDTLISYIRGAQHNINMTMFFFRTTKSANNRPSIIVQELIKARKRGVDIHVILDESNYNKEVSKENNKVARKLRRNNIDVLMDSEKKTTHSKLVVIDKVFSFVGSHNFTHSALTYNNEFSLLVDSRPLASELLQYMKSIK